MARAQREQGRCRPSADVSQSTYLAVAEVRSELYKRASRFCFASLGPKFCILPHRPRRPLSSFSSSGHHEHIGEYNHPAQPSQPSLAYATASLVGHAPAPVLTIAAMGRTTTTPQLHGSVSPASTRVHRAGRAAKPHSMSSRTSRASSTHPIPASCPTDLDIYLPQWVSYPRIRRQGCTAPKSRSQCPHQGLPPQGTCHPRGCVVLRQPRHRSARITPTLYLHSPSHKCAPPHRNPTLQTRPTRSSPTTLSPSMLPRHSPIPSTRMSSSSS